MTVWTRRAVLAGTTIIAAAAVFAIRRTRSFNVGTPMGSESLRARLTAVRLDRVADDIIRLAMPSIRMNCRRATDGTALPLGGSRLGGAPDRPPGMNWPM